MVYGRSNRTALIEADVVAIPLQRIFSRRSGQLLVRSRKELCERFLLHYNAKIIVTAVHYDQTLESYWSVGRRCAIERQLVDVGADLLTTPNFSVFADVPRWDNFHNMKRIAIVWHELAAADNTVALHVNARTDRDYERWTDFLNKHSEIAAVAFEFETGPASPRRGAWHAQQLNSLAAAVKQHLTLVCVGGFSHLMCLRQRFKNVVHVSATPYMKASHYQKLIITDGVVHAARARSMLMDQLLALNIRTYRKQVLRGCSAA